LQKQLLSTTTKKRSESQVSTYRVLSTSTGYTMDWIPKLSASTLDTMPRHCYTGGNSEGSFDRCVGWRIQNFHPLFRYIASHCKVLAVVLAQWFWWGKMLKQLEN